MTNQKLIEVNNLTELYNKINESEIEISFIMFSASWCMPCKVLKDKFKKMEHKVNIYYIDIDNDAFDTIIEKYNISSIPFGLVIKRTEKIKSIEDIDKSIIEKNVGGNFINYNKFFA